MIFTNEIKNKNRFAGLPSELLSFLLDFKNLNNVQNEILLDYESRIISGLIQNPFTDCGKLNEEETAYSIVKEKTSVDFGIKEFYNQAKINFENFLKRNQNLYTEDQLKAFRFSIINYLLKSELFNEEQDKLNERAALVLHNLQNSPVEKVVEYLAELYKILNEIFELEGYSNKFVDLGHRYYNESQVYYLSMRDLYQKFLDNNVLTEESRLDIEKKIIALNKILDHLEETSTSENFKQAMSLSKEILNDLEKLKMLEEEALVNLEKKLNELIIRSTSESVVQNRIEGLINVFCQLRNELSRIDPLNINNFVLEFHGRKLV